MNVLDALLALFEVPDPSSNEKNSNMARAQRIVALFIVAFIAMIVGVGFYATLA